MRRAYKVGFFLAALAASALLYLRNAERTAAPKSSETGSPLAMPLPEPPPRLAPQRPPQHPLPNTQAPVAQPSMDEKSLMQHLRTLVKSDPPIAEALAREARQRFPASAEADERDALLVDALINEQRIGAARTETYYYFDHHPGGRFADHLFTMTGVHPTPPRPGPTGQDDRRAP